MLSKIYLAFLLTLGINISAYGETFFGGLIALNIPSGFKLIDLGKLPGGDSPNMPGVETIKLHYVSAKGTSLILMQMDFNLDLNAAGLTPAYIVQTSMGTAVEPKMTSLSGIPAAKVRNESPSNKEGLLSTTYGIIMGTKSILLVAVGLPTSDDYQLAINAIETIKISLPTK